MELLLLIKRVLVTIGWPILQAYKKLGSKLILIKQRMSRLKWPKTPAEEKREKEVGGRKRGERLKLKFDVGYLILTLLTMAMTGGCLWVYTQIIKQLPDVNEVYNPPRLSTRILARDGRLLYKFYREENRSWVKYEEIPQSVIWATLAIEDKEFYNHRGLSVRGLLTAVWYNIRNGEDQGWHGGSTITQQLVKNVFLTSEKTWKRKIKEAILALQIERKMSKEEILEKYLNEVPYGGETYGISEAAERYFGKKVAELSLGEAAFLAGLPAAPTSYVQTAMDYGGLRQKRVLEEMVKAGYISTKVAKETYNSGLEVRDRAERMVAPHFVFYVRDYLKDKFGYQNIESRGLKVTTTLDLDTQLMVEKVVVEELDKIKRLKISNGAAEVVDTRNGEILAMVGSKGYYAADIDGKYNVTIAERQPGSSIKPINYLLALKRGKTLLTTISDDPVVYNLPGQKPYKPQNYNGKYMGTVTLKTALASSLNIPSVKILNENGVENMIDLAEKMGITTWTDRKKYGLSLALGAGEVRMVDMAVAYSTLSQMGQKVETGPILRIDNYLNENIWKKEIEKETIFEPEYAFLINQALSDDVSRSPVFGAGSKLVIPGKTVAVKTGTTNSLKDNWCIGWTPSLLTTVWVGNNDNSPMSWVASGVTGATPIWNRIMREVLKDRPDEKWEPPSNVKRISRCDRQEYFILGTEHGVACPPSITPTPTAQPS